MIRFLLLLAFFIPLTLHIHPHNTPPEVRMVFPGYEMELDIFNWWKSACLYGIATLIVLIHFLKPKRNRIPIKYTAPLVTYVLLVIMSAVCSNSFELAWFGMTNYLEGATAIVAYCVLFYFSASYMRNIRAIDIVLSVVTLLMLAVCSVQFFRTDTFSLPIIRNLILGSLIDKVGISSYAWPLYGTIMNSNILGTFAALVYAFFLGRKNWSMVCASILIALGAQSRGAFLAMGIATLYVFFNSGLGKKVIVVPAITALIGFGLMQFNLLGKFHIPILNSSGRTFVWRETLKIIQAPNLIGEGPGIFALKFPQADTPEKLANGWPRGTVIDRPHNFYLNTLYSSGVLGLCTVLFLFFTFFCDVYLVQRNNKCLIPISAAVLSYLLNVFFTDSCTAVAPLFWIILGTGVGLINDSKINKSKSRSKLCPR